MNPKSEFEIVFPVRGGSLEIRFATQKALRFRGLSKTFVVCLKFSGLLPDAIQSDCASCSAAQKRNSRKVITFLRTRRPQDWKKLTDKYDPQGLFNQRINKN